MIDVAALDRAADPMVVARALGLKPERGSRPDRVLTCCPVHKEKTPSFKLDRGPRGTIRGHCFGCSVTLDLLGIVGAVRGLDPRHDFRACAEAAADIVGVTLDVGPRSPAPRRDPIIDLAQRIDDAADRWLRGRPGQDAVIEAALPSERVAALAVLRAADAKDRELDRLAIAFEERGGQDWIARARAAGCTQ